MRLARRLVLAFWAGGLVTIGFVVAPTLFRVLADRRLAGQIAGELFRVATLGSLLLAALLWVPALRRQAPAAALPELARTLAPAALLAASEWLVRPALEAARAAGGSASTAFAAWHGVSTLLYGLATALVVAALVVDLRR